MNVLIRHGWMVLLCFAAVSVKGADQLIWRTNPERVTADIQSAEIFHVLEGVAKLTGWRVFIESNVTDRVSVKFTDRSSGDALRLLLGDLNYALVPQTNAGPSLYVFRTERANATLLVRPGDINPGKKLESKRIPNELIVRLKPGANIEELAKKLGAKVLGKIEGLNAYRLQFSDEAAANAALAQLGADPGVTSVENNYVMEQPPLAAKLESGNAGLPGPLQLQLNPPAENGRVLVGLVDTAVQSLGNNLDQFLTKSISIDGAANLDPSVPSHGTSMFQDILRGVANSAGGSSSVQVLSVDVYGPNQSANSFDVAAGIAAAVNNGATLINLSLGSDYDSQILQDIVQQTIAKGIPVFAAAGNTPVSTPFYPAAIPGVISVTAGSQGQLAPYANYADYVKLMLPGSAVVYFGNQSYIVTGTSTSSALSSGLAAGVADSKHVNSMTAANALLNTSSLLFAPKK